MVARALSFCDEAGRAWRWRAHHHRGNAPVEWHRAVVRRGDDGCPMPAGGSAWQADSNSFHELALLPWRRARPFSTALHLGGGVRAAKMAAPDVMASSSTYFKCGNMLVRRRPAKEKASSRPEGCARVSVICAANILARAIEPASCRENGALGGFRRAGGTNRRRQARVAVALRSLVLTRECARIDYVCVIVSMPARWRRARRRPASELRVGREVSARSSIASARACREIIARLNDFIEMAWRILRRA